MPRASTNSRKNDRGRAANVSLKPMKRAKAGAKKDSAARANHLLDIRLLIVSSRPL